MSYKRGALILGTLRHLQRNPAINKGLICSTVNQQFRAAHVYYNYRKMVLYEKPLRANIIGGVLWWWILWHLMTNYEEFYEPVFPDPSKWTDEELGVPPIDV